MASSRGCQRHCEIEAIGRKRRGIEMRRKAREQVADDAPCDEGAGVAFTAMAGGDRKASYLARTANKRAPSRRPWPEAGVAADDAALCQPRHQVDSPARNLREALPVHLTVVSGKF